MTNNSRCVKVGWRTRKAAGEALEARGFRDFCLCTRGRPNKEFSGMIGDRYGTASVVSCGARRWAVSVVYCDGLATSEAQLNDMLRKTAK